MEKIEVVDKIGLCNYLMRCGTGTKEQAAGVTQASSLHNYECCR